MLATIRSHFRVTPKSLGMFIAAVSAWLATLGDKAITPRDVLVLVVSFLSATLVPQRSRDSAASDSETESGA